MIEAGISGPVFVSIGDSDKLNAFLDSNPNVPRENLFVDDEDSIAAYKAVGFKSFTENFKNLNELRKIKSFSLPSLF